MSAGFKMVAFLQKYTEAMAIQITAIQSHVDTSVGGVMQSLQGLSASTEEKKAEAERVLEATYLTPDAKTSLMVDSIQKSTDDIFEQAKLEVASDSVAAPQPASIATTDDMRRMGGLFSKHMESISTMDDSLRNVVMAMVGSLSNTDVITQRLEHITQMLRALNLGLGNVLVDLDSRLNDQVVETFRDNLLDFSYKVYSVEEERVAFKKIFGAPPQIQKAYAQKIS